MGATPKTLRKQKPKYTPPSPLLKNKIKFKRQNKTKANLKKGRKLS
jgi:hypothetical protein